MKHAQWLDEILKPAHIGILQAEHWSRAYVAAFSRNVENPAKYADAALRDWKACFMSNWDGK